MLKAEFLTKDAKLLPDRKINIARRFNYRFAVENILGDVVLDVGSAGRRYFAKLVESRGCKYYHCDLKPIGKVDYKRNYFVADGRHLPREACADTITAIWWIHHYRPLEQIMGIIEGLRRRCRRLVFTADYNVPDVSAPRCLPPSVWVREEPRERGFSRNDLSQLGVEKIPETKDLVIYGGPKVAIVGLVMEGRLSKDDVQNAEEGLKRLTGRNFL